MNNYFEVDISMSFSLSFYILNADLIHLINL